jgi:hypothetical protein
MGKRNRNMKVDRVILASNNNPTYYHFWNPLSKVYNEKFGINPTLLWVGEESEIESLGLSNEYGDIITVQAHPDYHIPWQTTWGMFWVTQFYPDDTCLIIGIDQVPLSNLFLNMVSPFSDDSYAMLIADAYRPNHWSIEGSASPSSYHIAKGSTFQKIYNFDSDFKSEMTKVHDSGIKGFWEDTAGRWGIDETYSSAKLRATDVPIHSLDNFTLLCERRIECERHKETPYNLDLLRSGWYSESHLCRPFTNHVEYITNLFNNIPSCL